MDSVRNTTSTPDTYEAVLALVEGLPVSNEADERRIRWLTEPAVLGVARSPEGRVEIFLVGDELDPRSARLRNNVIHQEWHRAEGRPPILANRILLPPAGHFEQVGAFLCIELIRNGVAQDPTAAFRCTEPVIELALEQLRWADEDLIGLCGELLVLQAMLRAVPHDAKGAVLLSWKGHQRSSRDFELGGTGIEVKCTMGSTSSHQMQGLRQVEAGHSSSGEPESAFYLASIGLEGLPGSSSPSSGSFCLPSLAQAIVDDLAAAGVEPETQQWFLRALRDYGSARSMGYVHLDADSQRAYGRRFKVTFARLYDMLDQNVQVLRSDDVRRYPFTDAESLRFRINLPEQVTGDVNPIGGLDAISRSLIDNQ